jgi:hypothetical protein
MLRCEQTDQVWHLIAPWPQAADMHWERLFDSRAVLTEGALQGLHAAERTNSRPAPWRSYAWQRVEHTA